MNESIKEITIDFNISQIPHIGDSHCLVFAHQTLNLKNINKRIQPAYIVGAKAFHLSANSQNKSIKSFFKSQLKNFRDSNEILISFGEIDCRKNEGILTYALKNKKDIIEVCKETIIKYLDFTEETLYDSFSKRYYFGIPAPTFAVEKLDELDKKRIILIREFNNIMKGEVLRRGSSFLDSYALTSKNGFNNNLYMNDEYHLHSKCLSILFNKYLYENK